MIQPVREKITDISRICERYRVSRLELFGSAIGDSFENEKSDIDLLVEFLPLKPGEHADCYFGLLEDLEELLGCHVDLIMIKAVKNPYFLEAIDNERTLIYAA